MKQRTSLFVAATAILLALAGCSEAPAPIMASSYVGTWHIAGQADPTTLTFGDDTFTYTTGDGTTALQRRLPTQDGMDAPPEIATMLTVRGSLSVRAGTSFKLTIPEEGGVVLKFVEGVDEFTHALTTGLFTAIYRGFTEKPMTVRIDDDGTTMTITGLFSGLLTQQDPRVELTACKDAPCAGR